MPSSASASSAGSTPAEPGHPIAVGRTAEVFAHGQDRVLKVLRPGFPDALGEEEAIAAAMADAAGIGAPRFFGTTRVDGRIALIYERRDGPSMLEQLVSRPWSAHRMGTTLGELHAAMHEAPAQGLPDLVAAMREAVRGGEAHADAEASARALARIEALPAGDALCHGDFHPGNVVMSASGPAVIDWLTAGSGPPAADVARTLFLVRDGRIPPEASPLRRRLIGLLRHRFSDGYLAGYRRRRSLDPDEVAAWRLPILVARLDEGIEDERAHVRALIEGELGTAAR